MTLQTKEYIEFENKVFEVANHPAWQGSIDEKTSVDLLQNQPIMTYLLRQDNEDFWLLHKKSIGEIHKIPHRYFTITREDREDLDRRFSFIQGALARTKQSSDIPIKKD